MQKVQGTVGGLLLTLKYLPKRLFQLQPFFPTLMQKVHNVYDQCILIGLL